jgi:hypothetical protein
LIIILFDMSNGVVVMASYIIENLPGRNDYFGETKYYSPRFDKHENHSPPKLGEGRYYSPKFATHEIITPPNVVPPKNETNTRENEHVRGTGQTSYSSPENEEYYGSPPNASIDALILFTSSYLEENRKRYDLERYLVCDSCGGYYQLGDDEEPEDFSDQCDCGGRLEYRCGSD